MEPITTIEEYRARFKPKEGFEIVGKKSDLTGRFIACVFKKTVISRYSKEYASGAILNISEENIQEYIRKLKPYVDEHSR